jgi:hypothetical protein
LWVIKEMGDRYGGGGGGGVGIGGTIPNFMGRDSNPLSITAMTSTIAPTSPQNYNQGNSYNNQHYVRREEVQKRTQSKGGSASGAEMGSYLDSKPGGAANNSERASKLESGSESGSESESGSFCKSYFCNKFNSVGLGNRRSYCMQP